MNKLRKQSGDDGFTNLANGKRVKKCSDIIELYGVIDELNVFLGHATESLCGNETFSNLLKSIYHIQRDLFELCSHVVSGQKFTLHPQKLEFLEGEIWTMSEKLPILKSFILPGGGEQASRIHVARAICRRAERIAFKLAETNDNATSIGIYLNRLSDWLYAAARTAALLTNAEEILV